jgi:predicted small lipoprotein YifL
MRRAVAVRCAALAALAALLAACGQKGALYLPDKNAALVTPPAQAPAAAPATQPGSAPTPQPEATPAPPKKTDKDDESQTPP